MELIEFLPRRDKSFLSDVFGQIRITQHCIRAAEGHILKTDYELGERFMTHREGFARV
jgi:hypothetical protein